MTKARGLTYADVAEEAGVHEITIAKLATGKQNMTLEWMRRLAKIYGCTPAEVVWHPPAAGLRRVTVTGILQAGAWSAGEPLSETDRYDVMVPDDARLRAVSLYGGEIRGESMNLRYPEGAVVVMSPIAGTAPREIIPGRRYHVRRVRPDGSVEETIKTLAVDADGRYWLKPESDNPQFQAWISLDDGTDTTVELVGRVRFVVQRED